MTDSSVPLPSPGYKIRTQSHICREIGSSRRARRRDAPLEGARFRHRRRIQRPRPSGPCTSHSSLGAALPSHSPDRRTLRTPGDAPPPGTPGTRPSQAWPSASGRSSYPRRTTSIILDARGDNVQNTVFWIVQLSILVLWWRIEHVSAPPVGLRLRGSRHMRVLEDHLPPPPRDVVEPAHFENGPEPQITGLGTGPDDPAAWLDIDSLSMYNLIYNTTLSHDVKFNYYYTLAWF